MKSTTKSIIIIAILAILIAISGCTSVNYDNNYGVRGNDILPQPPNGTSPPPPPPNDNVLITAGVSPYSAEESNNTLVYGGQVRLPTTADGNNYLKVIKMYDTAENNVCYITYNGISCLKKEVK